MSIGRATNKIRQVFNLLLLFLLITAAAAVFIWFLTTPEDRGTTFWISMGALAFTLLLGFLFASKIAIGSGRDTSAGFSQFYVLGGYFLFVAGLSIANALVGFSVTTYVLIHVGGAVLFCVPLLLSNMMMLKLSGADRREQREVRQSLALKASHLQDQARRIEVSFNTSREQLAPILRLSEAIQYSDPNPASSDTELSLDRALGSLDGAINAFIDDAGAERDAKWQMVLSACAAADAALRQRSTELLHRK